MSSSIRTFLPISCEPEGLVEAFEGDPGRWLPDSRRDGPDHWMAPVRAGSLRHTVRVQVGESWRSGTTVWRRLAWEPIAPEGESGLIERALPSLESEVGLHHQQDGRCTLVVDARYDPPGGALGAAADVVALRRVARRTVDSFMQAVAARLSAEALLVDPGTGDAEGDHPMGTLQSTTAPSPSSRAEMMSSPPRF